MIALIVNNFYGVHCHQGVDKCLKIINLLIVLNNNFFIENK